MNDPQVPQNPGRVLCKFDGMLVIAEVQATKDGQPGKCPQCGSVDFHENAGWSECDCGFAYLTSGIKKITN
jgi:hypothetical protein